MRRKLKKFKKLYENGELTFEQINSSYQSWRGFMLRKNGYNTVRSMDAIFKEDFVIPERNRRNTDNTRKQLEENQYSKKSKNKNNQIKKKNSVPTIKQEDKIDPNLEEKFLDGSKMTVIIGRDDTRNYHKDKNKPGRKRIASTLVEKAPDERMSRREVADMKRKVDKNKRDKDKAIKESYDEKRKEVK